MNAEQRYLFDLFGFLHLKAALTPRQLVAASEAANRYIDGAAEDRPPEFTANGKGHAHGFAYDRELADRTGVDQRQAHACERHADG